MIPQFVLFIVFMLAVFYMKCKDTSHAQIQSAKAQMREPNVKLGMPLLEKNMWSTVDSFLLPQHEKKFNEIHKSFSRYPTKFKNVSEKMRKRLRGSKISWVFFKYFETQRPKMRWLFFEHFETQEIFAQNVDEKNTLKMTALHFAARMNEVEIAKSLIDAGLDIDAKDDDGWTALHFAAGNNNLKIGKVLADASADMDIESINNETALEFAERYNHSDFAEILRQKMKN